ncbi:MAG: hypothetical protein R3C28_07915 [Pirellulaceae bacterium]
MNHFMNAADRIRDNVLPCGAAWQTTRSESGRNGADIRLIAVTKYVDARPRHWSRKLAVWIWAKVDLKRYGPKRTNWHH